MSKKPTGKQGIEHVERTSADLLTDNVARLREMFPQAVAEGKIDFAKLRELLGDEVDDRPERYSFTWAGKRDAIRLLQVPSRATLVPAPEESVDFEKTGNVFIEGENLEVLKLLYKSYAGRVKMIYIDPPYNTGNDFIYPDNFADPLDTYLKLTGQKDSEGNLLTSNPESSGRYHSAWLSMMYPRLFVARQLLTDDGVIFVSVDDHEAANLRLLMNEIFGEENFLAAVAWQKKYSPSNDAIDMSDAYDTIMVYRRQQAEVDGERRRSSLNRLERGDKQDAAYRNPDNDPRGVWKAGDYTCNKSAEERPSLHYAIVHPKTGKEVWPSKTRVWAFSGEKHEQNVRDNRVWWGPDGNASRPSYKRFLTDVAGMVPSNWWTWEHFGHTDEAKKELKSLFPESDRLFDTPKPTKLIRRIVELATAADQGHIVLDFFAGSCTTAHAVLEANRHDGGNRRFVVVQLPELSSGDGGTRISDIGKERIRRVINARKDDAKGKLDLQDHESPEDLGFRVFKLAASSYRPWRGVEDKDGENYAKTMEMFTDPLLPGWRPMNVIREVALKEGYSLTSTVEQLPAVKDNTVYRVTDADKGQSFLICLDDKLKAAGVKAMGLKQDDLFICRDVAITDEQAANLALQCNLKTI